MTSSVPDERVFVGTAEFYCECSGTDACHSLFMVLRPDETCSDLRHVLVRCDHCDAEKVMK